MNHEQFLRIVSLMERLDRGEHAPRLPGPYGHFLRMYAHERNDVLKLALDEEIDIRRDGTISGRPLGRITVSPLFSEDSSEVRDSHWGKVARYLVLCPELMTAVVLRVWLSGESGRDAFRELEGSAGSLTMHGDFRWIPPGFITTGTADFEAKDEVVESWESAPYLKITADDLVDVPHALDHLDLYLERRPVLAHVRVALVVRRRDGRLYVPAALRREPRPLTINNQKGAEALLAPGQLLFLVLMYREVGEDSWRLWRAKPATVAQAVDHTLRWVEFARFLANEPLTGDIPSAVLGSLNFGGIEVGSEDLRELQEIALGETPLAAFARSIMRRMRLSR